MKPLLHAGRPLSATHRRQQISDYYPQLVSSSITSETQSAAVWTSVTTDTAAHTKGGWVELVASTVDDVDIIYLMWYGVGRSGAANAGLVDIGIGGAGSETVIAPNVGLHYSAGSTVSWVGSLMVPVRVPQGSRIAVRWQAERSAASAANFRADLYRWPIVSGLRSPDKLINLNADTATSKGTSLGTTSNTWVEAVASSPQTFQGVLLCPASSDTTQSASAVIFDVGIGSSGAEVVAPNLDGQWRASTAEDILRITSIGFGMTPVHIPTGARIALRYRDASANNSAYSAVILGVPYT